MAEIEAVAGAVREAIAAGALWREQLALVVRAVNDVGAAAFAAGDYAAVEQMRQRVEALQALRREAEALEERIHAALDELAVPALGEASGVYFPQASQPRAPGRRTPPRAFRVPILRALAELGGRARASDVLDKVYAALEDKLLPRDLEPLPSHPTTQRWRNTAGWEGYRLRQEGLLASDSVGVWEITAEGRRWLEEQGLTGASQLDGAKGHG